MRGSRLFLQPFRPEVDWSGWGYQRSPRLPPTALLDLHERLVKPTPADERAAVREATCAP